ncbi:hypothetical protein ACFW96_11255 [Streptomyces gardneri]|uniref:hypothetical protein n=1 Tax=Streptomyces gardneri TaxID=66892 RepID=UPI0036998FBA
MKLYRCTTTDTTAGVVVVVGGWSSMKAVPAVAEAAPLPVPAQLLHQLVGVLGTAPSPRRVSTRTCRWSS